MRRYTITFKAERDAARRIDASTHRRAIEAAVRRALPAGWTLAGARVSSRRMVEPKPEPATPRQPKPRDPLARISAGLPDREWIAGVLKDEGMARWRVARKGRRGYCAPWSHTIYVGSAWSNRDGGLEYALVGAWLRARQAEPARVGGLRYMVLHEIAHGLSAKRLDAATRTAWRQGRRPPGRYGKGRDRTHGTRFRVALLRLLRRHAPEAFAAPVAASAAGPVPTTAPGGKE